MPDEQREPTQARVHELKTLPGFIDAIEESGKNFEVRINDRRFLTGDTLHLREFDPDEGYSGREIERVVGYILEGFPGIESGYCVMALEPAPTDQGERDGLVDKLDAMAANPGHSWPVVSRILRKAASTIDHQTKALEAADELARVVSARVAPPPESSQLLGLTAARDLYRAHDAYLATRPTEGEDAG